MAGRPSKFTPERTKPLIDRLQAGATRKAAAESVGVSYDCFLDWLKRGEEAAQALAAAAAEGAEPGEGDGPEDPFLQFFQAVTRAEAEAEVRNTAILQKAGSGWDVVEHTRITKTVIETRKIHKPDGTVIEEPVAIQDVTEKTVERGEFDWRASLEWLKRRRRNSWSEKADVEHSGTVKVGLSYEDALQVLLDPGGAAAAADADETADDAEDCPGSTGI